MKYCLNQVNQGYKFNSDKGYRLFKVKSKVGLNSHIHIHTPLTLSSVQAPV